MKRVRYPAELKAEAVKPMTERGHGVVDVAKRLGVPDRLAPTSKNGATVFPIFE